MSQGQSTRAQYEGSENAASCRSHRQYDMEDEKSGIAGVQENAESRELIVMATEDCAFCFVSTLKDGRVGKCHSSARRPKNRTLYGPL